jgi:hypothetical protein
MLQYDRDIASNPFMLEHDTNVEIENSSGSGEDELIQHQSGSFVRRHSKAIPGYHPRDGHNSFRTLSPQEPHHTVSHTPPGPLPYTTLPAVNTIEPPLSNIHYPSTPVYQTQAPVVRPQEQWSPESDYASALVGALKIDDSGVGK